MRFHISPAEIKQANIPHEIFLTNLIANHILLSVGLGGLAGSFPWVMAVPPLISFSLLIYTLWRARRALNRDPWYPRCHWQVCARRSRMFIGMLILLLIVALLGWIGYSQLGWKKEAFWAILVGMGILPVMVTVLVLILFESEALYHANQARLPAWVVERHPPPPGITAIEEVKPPYYD